jgi:predicted DNA-binding protein (UPF0278 family)
VGAVLKDILQEYYRPTAEDFTELWDTALVAFDANVLLHVLRFKKSSADEVLAVIEALGDRAWVPHQAATEFLRNRHSVFSSLAQPYQKLETYFEQQSTAIAEEIGSIQKQFRDHPSIDFDALIKDAAALFKELRKKLKAQQKAHPSSDEAEAVVDRVTSLFKGRTGPRPKQEEVDTWKKQAKERYERQIPPGYLDSKKDDGGFGDYFMWQQLIAHSIDKKTPIILVTDDVKDDWWLRVAGRTVGPRPELRREFLDLTSHSFYTYTLPEYLRHSKSSGSKVSDAAVREAEVEVARSREQQFLRHSVAMLIRQDEEASLVLRELDARRQSLLRQIEQVRDATASDSDALNEGLHMPRRRAAERLLEEESRLLAAIRQVEAELADARRRQGILREHQDALLLDSPKKKPT